MSKIINYIRDKIEERKWLKEKPCAACKYFDYYMGSAGVCTAKNGHPATRIKIVQNIAIADASRKGGANG